MEYYSSIKNEILPTVATWMDLEDIMLSEISQRKTNAILYHLYKWNLKNTSKTVVLNCYSEYNKKRSLRDRTN